VTHERSNRQHLRWVFLMPASHRRPAVRTLATVGVIAALAILTSCSDSAEPAAIRTPVPSSSPSEPTAAAPSPIASPAASGTAARAVYYLHDTGNGIRLYREFHRRPATTGVMRDAVTAMLTEKPTDPDYTSLWPAGTTVRGARISGTTAYVDLSAEARQGKAGAEGEAASLQQLVHTVTAAAPAVTQVQLLVEGKAVESLWGHVDTRKPVDRQPAAEILGPVWILVPADGQLARGDIFGGEATVFEATVSWELLQGDKVVKEGFTNASVGAPGRGRWSAKADVPPGSYVLRAFESSAEDGRPTFVDDKPLTVT
jgi:hypothetical protein